MRAVAVLGFALLLSGCPGPEPVFDAEYRSKYQQVYSCAESVDHALMHVVIWADEKGAPAYDGGTAGEGATVVKEEFSDSSCTDLSGYSVMKKDAARQNAHGWFFQVLDAKRNVTDEGTPKQCVSCHEGCGGNTDLLCAVSGR